MLGNDTKLAQQRSNLLSRNLNLLNNECVQNIVLSEKDIEELRSVRTHGISSRNFKILNILLANSSKSGDFSVFFEELLSRLGRGKSKRIRRESSFLILQSAGGKYSIERSINAICERYNGQGLLYIFEIQESKISKLSIICANGKLKYKPVFFKVTPLQYAVENDDIQTVGMLCNVLMNYEDGKQIVKEVTRYVLSKINRKQDNVTDKVLE
ncbi:putative integral membrane protein, partial [Ehrlichia ruminantium]